MNLSFPLLLHLLRVLRSAYHPCDLTGKARDLGEDWFTIAQTTSEKHDDNTKKKNEMHRKINGMSVSLETAPLNYRRQAFERAHRTMFYTQDTKGYAVEPPLSKDA